MKRWSLVAFGSIAVLVVGLRQFLPPAQAGADAPAAPGLSGKPIFLLAKDNVAIAMEKPEVKQLGGRSFLVGREMKNATPQYVKERFGGAVVWVPVDSVMQIVEIEPPLREK